MGLKDRISSPLEAGPSLLNDHHLSPSLTPALEHASSRLAKKSLHLTLVVVRRDYQLPTTAALSPLLCLASTSISPSPSTSSSSSSLTSSLSRRSFASRPVTALKQLVRTGSCRHGPGTASDHARSNDMSCGSRLKRANSSTGAHGPQLRRPISSMAPLSPPPPMTPYTPSSMATMTTATTTDHPGPVTSRAPGFLLFHAPDLSPCDQKAQRAIFTRTARKFNLPLLTPAVSPLAYGLSSQLFTNSVIQHQVLFSSDGLTILALDRLYSLKAALASYARIKTPLRLEDAVDELRRYVLAGNGAPVTKSHLFRAYDWLNVGPGAVADLDSMYKRAYGGPDQVGAIAGIEPITHPPAPLPPLRAANDEFPEAESPCHDRQRYLSPSMNGLRICPEPDGYALAGYSDEDPELHLDQDFDRQHYSSSLMNEPRIRPETDGYLLAGYQDGGSELHADQNHDCQYYLSPSMKEPRIRPEPDGYAFTDYQDQDPELHPDQIGLAITTYSDTSKPAPASRGPALRIQSDFQSASRPLVLRSKWGYEDDDDDDEHEHKHETSNATGNGTNSATNNHKHTAVEQQAHEMHRTTRFQAPAMGFVPWKSRSVGRLRGVGGGSVTIPEEIPRQPCQGPVTPNDHDDISPITGRGEWSFLMVDEPSAKGRTGTVGT
ncbi:hypothetical protein E4U14_008250 [Claviceps sp. LM454 group G7]|nr:hypothetical protein E4U14_008250 [Claviceps sp. LM454 group G7]